MSQTGKTGKQGVVDVDSVRGMHVGDVLTLTAKGTARALLTKRAGIAWGAAKTLTVVGCHKQKTVYGSGTKPHTDYMITLQRDDDEGSKRMFFTYIVPKPDKGAGVSIKRAATA